MHLDLRPKWIANCLLSSSESDTFDLMIRLSRNRTSLRRRMLSNKAIKIHNIYAFGPDKLMCNLCTSTCDDRLAVAISSDLKCFNKYRQIDIPTPQSLSWLAGSLCCKLWLYIYLLEMHCKPIITSACLNAYTTYILFLLPSLGTLLFILLLPPPFGSLT